MLTNSIFNHQTTWSTDLVTPTLGQLDHLLAQGRFQDSLNLIEGAIRRWPDETMLLKRGAYLANQAGRTVAAIELLSRAEKHGDHQAARDRQTIIDQTAPLWHFRMMNDEVRNTAYDRALQHWIKPDSLVLDIGCGAGLLSMMAARAGAAEIHACEVSELMHHQAIMAFEKNQLSERITAHRMISHQLKVGEHLPRKADIIVAEVFDTGLLGEDVLSTFVHAREHLLAPGGIILPARASIQAKLIESDLLHKEATIDQGAGFDVDMLNELSPSYIQARLSAYEHHSLSNFDNVLAFNFEQNDPNNRTITHAFNCTKDGLCHGVAFWFTLDFGNHITLSTGPENPWNCWMQAVSLFRTPRHLLAGESLEVEIRQTTNRISFKPK